MKKKFVFMLCIVASVMHVQALEKINVDGTVKSLPAGRKVVVQLYYPTAQGAFVRDSCKVVDGHFSFSKQLEKPVRAYLAITEDGESFNNAFMRPKANQMAQIGFTMENGTVKAVLDYVKPEIVSITGTPTNDVFQETRAMMGVFKQREADIYKKNATVKTGTPEAEKIMEEYNQMISERNKAVGGFVKAHADIQTSLDLLVRWVDPTQSVSDAKTYFSYLNPTIKEQGVAKRYLSKIEEASKLDIHAMAPNFSLPDTTGKVFQINDFKGKYVLVDFWASWCGPCRAETPNLVKVYEQYKNKGFEIVAVSLDGGKNDSRAKWIEAIKKDKMTWPQLSDLSGMDGEAARLYMISSIPMNFLLSPTGEIVGKNLRGKDLVDALKKLKI